jgi:2-amino-4-hydroxy-6-hydroxymethyldihydropteridine diphosphokinase
MTEAYIILGSNIEPEKNIEKALWLLKEMTAVNAISGIWETEAVGTDGPPFLNVVVRLETELDANKLKRQILFAIEEELKRVRLEDKFAPRTIDLDIVIFDNQVFDNELWNEAYIALPMAELNPALEEPRSGRRVLNIAKELFDAKIHFSRQDLDHLFGKNSEGN